MPIVKSVDAHTAHEWVSNNEAVVIDVREQAEYNQIHIEGAKLIPVGTINNELVPQVGDKKIIIHCLLGKRGSIACEKLLENNPDLEVYNLEGGITAWERAGYKVAKS